MNGDSKRDVKNHLLFEIATEVANRGMLHPSPTHLLRSTNSCAVGGIYSVLKSKAPVSTLEYGDRYTLIGPLNKASVSYLR
jgi:glycogen synthase